jgi:hypothetical protein
VEPVDVWNHEWQSEDEQEEVADEEIRAPERDLDRLHYEFTGRLRHGVIAEAASIPPTSPPGLVRLIVLELSRKEDRDEGLVNCTLNGYNGDETKYCVREIPEFEKPL